VERRSAGQDGGNHTILEDLKEEDISFAQQASEMQRRREPPTPQSDASSPQQKRFRQTKKASKVRQSRDEELI